jgi:hypothetical protein
MKTFKPNLEALEGRALMSGLWDPGPSGGTPLPTGPLGVPILAGIVATYGTGLSAGYGTPLGVPILAGKSTTYGTGLSEMIWTYTDL